MTTYGYIEYPKPVDLASLGSVVIYNNQHQVILRQPPRLIMLSMDTGRIYDETYYMFNLAMTTTTKRLSLSSLLSLWYQHQIHF